VSACVSASLGPRQLRAGRLLGARGTAGKSRIESPSYLCIGKDRGRYDLVRPKGLPRIDERREDLARLPALACGFELSVDVTERHLRVAESALTPHGRGQRVVEAQRHVGGDEECLWGLRRMCLRKEERSAVQCGAYAVKLLSGGVQVRVAVAQPATRFPWLAALHVVTSSLHHAERQSSHAVGSMAVPTGLDSKGNVCATKQPRPS
jgi:hypothetical protein